MNQNKVQLFEDQPIRTAWDEENEERKAASNRRSFDQYARLWFSFEIMIG